MADGTYNGFTNYATWLVDLHVQAFGGWEKIFNHEGVEIDLTVRQYAELDCARAMKRWYQDTILDQDFDEPTNKYERDVRLFTQDVIRSFFWEVDFEQLAEREVESFFESSATDES